jgi:hypothetical protein
VTPPFLKGDKGGLSNKEDLYNPSQSPPVQDRGKLLKKGRGMAFLLKAIHYPIIS